MAILDAYIAFALRKLSRFIKDPTITHIIALKNLMRYIRATIKIRLYYSLNRKRNLVIYLDVN